MLRLCSSRGVARWLPVITAIAIVISLGKCITFEPAPWGLPYLYLNYDNGIIKRGLFGEILSWLFSTMASSVVPTALVQLHYMFCAALIYLFLRFAHQSSQQAKDHCIWSIALICAVSQFWPTLACTPGFLDVEVYLFFFLALFAYFSGAYWVAAAIGFLSPFLHESAVFVWSPLVVLLAWEVVRTRRIAWKQWLPVGSLLLGCVLLLLLHNQEGAKALMLASPLSDRVKEGMVDIQMGQTLGWSFHALLRKWGWHYDRALFSFVFFDWPAFFMLWIYASMRQLRWHELAVILVSALAPLTIMLIAWDISRFMVYMMFAMAVAIMYWERIYQPAPKQPSCITAWLIAAAALLLFFTPFIYAFFEVALIFDNGLGALFFQTPWGKFVRHVYMDLYPTN